MPSTVLVMIMPLFRSLVHLLCCHCQPSAWFKCYCHDCNCYYQLCHYCSVIDKYNHYYSLYHYVIVITIIIVITITTITNIIMFISFHHNHHHHYHCYHHLSSSLLSNSFTKFCVVFLWKLELSDWSCALMSKDSYCSGKHDDVIKWKHFPRYWPFVRGIAQRPLTRSFDVFFDLRPNKRLSKQSLRWWFETPSGSLWRHCNDIYQYISYPFGWVHVRFSGSFPILYIILILLHISYIHVLCPTNILEVEFKCAACLNENRLFVQIRTTNSTYHSAKWASSSVLHSTKIQQKSRHPWSANGLKGNHTKLHSVEPNWILLLCNYTL